MNKSAEAFRTIGEVADELGIQKHVLRFWEGRFPQIRPMKRGGGRRYYRPEDMELLRGIRALLRAEGYTIRGVQKILREHGVEQVKAAAKRAAPPPATVPDAGGRKRGRKPAARVAAQEGAVPQSLPEAITGSQPHQNEREKPLLATKDQIAGAIRELGIARAILLGQPIHQAGLSAEAKKARAERT